MIAPVERKVAAFVAEYEALCRRHGCMVIMVEPDNEDDPSEYCAFAVGCFNEDTFLAQAVEEMRIEPARWIEEMEDSCGS